ncbi:MAG: thermonuclease family protein [Actinomycetota bacterium]
MGFRRLLAAAALLAGLASTPGATGGSAAQPVTLAATVERVVDGDTLVVRARGFDTPVRLLGIDTPEIHRPGRPVECWGREAAARTTRLAPPGSAVRLVTDPTQDTRDRYARLLAYAYRDGLATSVNYALVAGGHARAYVYDRSHPFRHAAAYLRAERGARTSGLGLWGPPCRGRATVPAAPAGTPARGGCSPAYPDVCIPPPPPDLDCRDVPHRDFRVLPPDPHRFDGGGDGVGCES